MPAELDDAAYAVARRVSRILERKYGRAVVPGELLAAAYAGACECPAAACVAAKRRCVDYLRERDGHMRYAGGRGAIRRREQRFPAGNWWHPTDRAAQPGERPTLLQLWCEAAPLRERWTWRQRVWVYLWAVEGLTFREVAAAVGVDKSTVTLVLAGVLPPGATTLANTSRRQLARAA